MAKGGIWWRSCGWRCRVEFVVEIAASLNAAVCGLFLAAFVAAGLTAAVASI